MTWRPYFRLAQAGREPELEPEHKLQPKLIEVTLMGFNVNNLGNTRFLKKEDCGDGIDITMDNLTEEDISGEGEPPKKKWILRFKEADVKPLVLNVKNAKTIARMFNDETGKSWPGKRIQAFHDPDVDFAGKVIGGIRVRKPATASTPAPAETDLSAETDFSDDIPF
ncbi:hypothetical protein N9H39_07085 [Gammaproteobacteria bacterium]|nr:hypothetical protein [Gammaproteobacteria bacterium]